MNVKPGISVYCEGGRPLCRIHRVVFGGGYSKGSRQKSESRYYCDGVAEELAPDHPMYGIGLTYRDESDPITDWFKTAQDAVDEWKRLKCLNRTRRKAKSASKKGAAVVGRTGGNRRRA